MRKRNKLYTANRWNQPLFMQDNIFADGGGFSLSQPSGLNYSTPQLTKPTINMPIDWSGYQGKIAVQNSQNLVNGFSKEASANNPFKGAKFNSGMSSLASAGIGAGMQMADNIQIGNSKRGLWDAADPVYYLADGRESAVGNGLSDAGVGVFKTGAQSGNGMLMLAGAGLKVLGGLTNAAFGTKWNKDTINAIEGNTSTMRNNAESLNGASTSDDFLSRASGLSTAGLNFSKGDIGKDGWFTHKVGKKFRSLQNSQSAAQAFANHALTTGAENVDKNLDDTVFTNFAAFGGPISTPSSGGAIDYGFMSDYLTMRNNEAQAKNKISNNVFGNLPVTPMSTFALGGDMQTNGSDFTDGLQVIGAGGSHEENPYSGVQVGISRDNGAPNLVEEGETIFDDYVFSRRIKADQQTKKKFHVGKNSDITYADLSKKLEKESLERPNDPISARGLEQQMHELADEQERQKGEEQQREAEEAFNQLPPEQQQAIMQQIAMEEQQAQEQQMQGGEQPPIEGQQEPQQMVDENMQQQMNPQMQEGSGEQINACGGKMNRFDKGGDMKKKVYGLLGLHTDSDFDKWANDHKMPKVTDWENILQNKQFIEALGGGNPALRDALSKGYDFGAFVPSKGNKLTFDFKHGGWGLENYDAWDGSTDAAWKEAVEKGLIKKGMNSEEIGKALSQTDAYKRGSDWLKADEGNRLTYLQSILNSQDAPQAARDYAARYVDGNGWLKDVKRDYQTIFEEPNGTGVRNTHPGTYWKTPNEILRDKQSGNYVINDDGTVEQIYGDVPKDWASAGNYNWQDDKSDYSYNYYKRPATSDATGNGNNVNEQQEELAPKHKPTWGRYAGLFGPAVGLGLQALGVGKPDYSRMDAAVEAASGAPALASYKPIGDYIGYRPMDIWYEQNRLNANSRATDRAILNNSSPIGTKMAGLLANGYNEQIGSGNLYRQALEYNDAQRQKVADFNRGTNMFNANAFNQTSATNAQLQNSQRNFKAQMQMDAARQRMAADAAWNQGIYGNVQGLFKGLSDWGKENVQHNMIADMAADGIFGTMNDQYISRDYTTKKTKKSKGGRINRRRGLTF